LRLTIQEYHFYVNNAKMANVRPTQQSVHHTHIFR